MRWMIWIGVAVSLLVAYFLLPILSPFVVGFIIAYLFNPLVTRLDQKGISRTLGASLIFTAGGLVLVLVLIALVPVLIDQIGRLVRVFPEFIEVLQTRVIPWFNENLGVALNLGYVRDLFAAPGAAAGKAAAEGAGVVAQGVGVVVGSGAAMMLSLMNFLLIPVVGFYLLRDWPLVVDQIERLLPRTWSTTVVRLARESDCMLGNFLRGQLAVMLANGATYSIGLTAIGLKTGIAIGMFAGLVSFVPYLGTIIGILLALLAMYIQSDGMWPLLLVLAVFAIGQMLETVAWQPRFVGNEIGMHPVAVIFAVLAGGQLFGFFGILLALPVSAVLIVLGQHALETYQCSRYYRGPMASPLHPAARRTDEPTED